MNDTTMMNSNQINPRFTSNIEKYIDYEAFLVNTMEDLYKLMLDKGLTEEDMAGKMEVTVTYLKSVFYGTVIINLETLVKMCSALDVSPTLVFKPKSA